MTLIVLIFRKNDFPGYIFSRFSYLEIFRWYYLSRFTKIHIFTFNTCFEFDFSKKKYHGCWISRSQKLVPLRYKEEGWNSGLFDPKFNILAIRPQIVEFNLTNTTYLWCIESCFRFDQQLFLFQFEEGILSSFPISLGNPKNQRSPSYFLSHFYHWFAFRRLNLIYCLEFLRNGTIHRLVLEQQNSTHLYSISLIYADDGDYKMSWKYL